MYHKKTPMLHFHDFVLALRAECIRDVMSPSHSRSVAKLQTLYSMSIT